MAFNEPVLTKRIPLDADKRHAVFYDEYVRTGGYATLRKALDLPPADITKLIGDANLRGRGGAGAPASMKWNFMPKPEAKKSPSYLVINADESEPGTFKDRYLLNYDPHQLLEGIAITSLAIHADVCYIFIRGEYHYTAKVLERAIKEAYDAGIFGQKGVLGNGKPLECYLHRGAGAYICGEETGLLEALEGKRGWPRNKPPFPAVYGAFGKPTTVNNVETIMLVPHIVERGAEWFKSMGTPSSPGPKLFGMSGHLNRPGVYEDELGITLDYAINKLAGGMKGGKFKASICGGISMGVLGPTQLDIKLDFDDVRFRGGCLGLGTAGMIVMNEHTDMVRALRNCVRFYSHESCGQCTPCREGSAWMKKILDRICDGHGRAKDLEMLLELEKTMGIMPGTTICGLADGTAWATRTFINKFYDEFAKACPEEPVKRTPLKIATGVVNVTTPMGSNTR
jgi:NADH-quinone oxidoreductase subunit F